MHRIKGLKFYIFFSFILVLGLIIGPNFKWLSPSRWWGESLVVLMNENEARPCGGFVTAFGVVDLPFGGVSLSNSFAFPLVDLGPSPEPLSQVAVEQKFWDLGTSSDLNHCGQQFLSAYERATDRFPDRVFLVQSGLVEKYLAALGPVEVGELTLSAQNFFAETSRLVADIDRHDENALENRKDPLNQFGKKLVISTIVRPWRWHAISQAVVEAEADGALYLHRPGHAQEQAWQLDAAHALTLSEWNLGGGKSSRYLDKNWTVALTQTAANTWQLENRLTVTHLGGQDEPLSQTWQGGFELKMFTEAPRFIPATIAPGATFTHTEVMTLSGESLGALDANVARLGIYAPPYQDWHTQLQIRALPQQLVQTDQPNLTVQENTALWRGQNNLAGAWFEFSLQSDTLAPFLTWHKPLVDPSATITEQLALSEGDVVVELHFNEPVTVLGATPEILENEIQRFTAADLNITLTDRNYAVPDVAEDLNVQSGLLLANKTTLLLKVRPETYQTNERYYLTISGLADQFGNTKTITERTVITR